MRVAGERHRQRQRSGRAPGRRPGDDEALLQAERPVHVPLAETRARIQDAVTPHAPRGLAERSHRGAVAHPTQAQPHVRRTRAERYPRAAKPQSEVLWRARCREPAVRGADPVGRTTGTQRCRYRPLQGRGKARESLVRGVAGARRGRHRGALTRQTVGDRRCEHHQQQRERRRRTPGHRGSPPRRHPSARRAIDRLQSTYPREHPAQPPWSRLHPPREACPTRIAYIRRGRSVPGRCVLRQGVSPRGSSALPVPAVEPADLLEPRARRDRAERRRDPVKPPRPAPPRLPGRTSRSRRLRRRWGC